VKPAARKQMAQELRQRHGLSARRACGLIGIPTCSLRYCSRRGDNTAVRQRMRELAQERPRYGYRRLGVLLRREGHRINHKRVLRLYREENLKLRPKRRKRVTSVQRVRPAATTRANQRWSMDFVSDVLSCGRRFRALNITDTHTRECLEIEVDTSLPGARVVRVLERVCARRGYPKVIQIDNGPEFAGKALDAWAYGHGVQLFFIEPGKPVQNAHIESFNGKLRDECLNQEWFINLHDARNIIENWRTDYNWVRPHSALNNLPPAVWAEQQKQADELTLQMR